MWYIMLHRRAALGLLAALPFSFGATAEAAKRERRTNYLKNVSSSELARHDILIYINKAANKQRMVVRRKPGGGWRSYKDWPVMHKWRVSTGREKQEKYFTRTPTGVFGIGRKHRMVISTTWNRAKLPYAMFLTRKRGENPYAIAIHGTNSTGRLGSRASGGCIRLSVSNAKKLYGYATQQKKKMLVVIDNA